MQIITYSLFKKPKTLETVSRRRENEIQSLMKSEQMYHKSLQDLFDEFLFPLSKMKLSSTHVQWITSMINSLELIYNDSRDLLEILQFQTKKNISLHVSPNFGTKLYESLPKMFHVYSKYCQSYSDSMMAQFRNQKSFEKLINGLSVTSVETSQKGPISQFNYLAIQPVQRAPKYLM